MAGCSAGGLPIADGPVSGGGGFGGGGFGGGGFGGGGGGFGGGGGGGFGGGNGGGGHGGGGPVDLGVGGAPDLASGGGDAGDLFGPMMTLMLPSNYSGLAAVIGDVTGDGRPDVVVDAYQVGTTNSAAVIVYPQNANGQLGTPIVHDVADAYVPQGSLAIGDLDGDGRLDIAITLGFSIGVLHQNAAGDFDPLQTLTPSMPGTEGTVAIADFDGDGRADLVAAGGPTGVDVWYQTAQGTLDGPHPLGCPDWAYETIAVADLDGDGRNDLILSGDEVSSGCEVLQGANGLGAASAVSFGNGAESMAAGDLDGDGRGDLFVVGGGNRPDSYVGLATAQPDGSFGAFSWMSSYDIPGDVLIADLDEDGHNDALVVHIGWLQLGFYRGNADGTLAPEQLIPFSYINWGTNRMAIGDINGDGHPDVAVVDGTLSILYHR